MSDPVAAYDHREALWVGCQLEKLNFYWFEESLADTDIHGYIELCRALDIPIACVEFLSGGLYTTAEYINCDFMAIIDVETEVWGLKREFRLDGDGCLAAPTGSGLGVEID